MAFCNSCGTSLEEGAGFCPKCGASQPGSAAIKTPPTVGPAVASAPQSSPPQQSNGLRTALIIVAAVFVLGAITIAALTAIGLHIARRTHVENRDGNVRVESPFGSVESSTDPAAVTRSLGADVYPGAQVLKNNSANVNIAGVHTVAADFETSDPIDKVADFYRSKFPHANVTTSDRGHLTIVSNEKGNLVTINLEGDEDKTVIHIANVSGKGVTGVPSD